MASFNVANLLSKIVNDIPGIKTVLTALAKWDLSALTDVPDGTMQATTDPSNRLTIKKKVSGSYVNVGQLQHSADMVDGYHASATATANTVAVRNAAGALPGNVLGNAETANTATALASGSVLPVNQGGTGGTTASAARSNLGVAGGADFTAHVTTAGSPSVTGHVALDALAADGSATAAPGKYGLGTSVCMVTSANDALNTGFYGFLDTDPSFDPASLPSDMSKYGLLLVLRRSASSVDQYIMGAENWVRRYISTTGAGNWYPLPSNMTDSTSMLSSTTAASATAVKAVNDSAVHVTGNEAISGQKVFSADPVILKDYPRLCLRNNTLTKGVVPTELKRTQIASTDSNNSFMGGVDYLAQTNGSAVTRLWVYRNTAGNDFASMELVYPASGAPYVTCPTPPDTATSNQMATAEWVLSHSSAEQVGDIIASFAATRAGCLLMNGGAVSRTTYANLFALIGTAFGAGNDTTTFNLPNARDRVFQGANGNLMQYLAAGLPGITGRVNIGALGGAGSGALYNVNTNAVERRTTDTSSNSGSVNIDASRSSSIYGASNTVQSAAITCNYFIKY